MTAGMLAMILAMGMTACANADTKEKSTTKKEQVSESDEKIRLRYGVDTRA